MVAETTDLLNSGELVEACGKAWTLSHATPVIRGAFSAWLKSRARQGLQQERADGSLTRETYREEADALKERFDAGDYNWGSPLGANDQGDAVKASLRGGDGIVKLVQLLLEAHHRDVPDLTVVEILNDSIEAAKKSGDKDEPGGLVAAAIKRCIQESLPNGQAPKTGTKA